MSKPRNAYIYLLTDPRPENRPMPVYIGKALSSSARFKAHLKEAMGSVVTRKNNWIKQLLRLKMKPVISCLEECNSDNYSDRERFWIFHYRCLPGIHVLNHTKGGDGGLIDTEAMVRHRASIIASFSDGKRRSQISAIVKKRWQDPEYRLRQSMAHKGHTPSPEAVEKRASKIRGRPWSARKRAAITAALMENRKPVINISTGIEYRNTREASNATGIPTGGISQSCTKGVLAMGTKWEWLRK